MKKRNNCKLWSVLLALSLILTSCLTLGISAEEAEIEQTQPIEPTEPENNGTAPDNEGADPEGGAADAPVEPEQGTEGLIYELNAAGTEYKVTGYEGTATEVVIPATYEGLPVTRIESDAFWNCGDLADIIIPESVTSIGTGAFFSCGSLTSITIPSSVTSISMGAVAHCSALESITVEDGNPIYHSAQNCLIETESKALIAGCKNSVIPADGSVTSIEEDAFSSCTGLTEIIIPDSVTSIGNSAFFGCWSLTEITIPNNVQSIGRQAFAHCHELTSITVPASVTYIGAMAFAPSSELTSITVEDGNPIYHSAENCIIETASKTLIAGCQNSVIPADGSVTSIGEDALAFSNLTSMTIPNGVTSIGSGAFSNCESLESITLPDSVTSIGDAAFYGCFHLTSMTVPANVTHVGAYAFADCSNLTNITIEGVLEYVGQYAFAWINETCAVSFAQNEPAPAWNSEWGTECPATIVWGDLEWIPTYSSEGLLYELNAEETEYSVTGYEGAATEVVIPATYEGLPVTSIGERAFEYCRDLTNIIIPESVMSIGSNAFIGCNGLTSIIIPDGVTRIASFAFQNCSNLMTIVLPASVTSIGSALFFGCINLTSITINEDNAVYHSAGNCIIETASKTLIAGCSASAIPTDGSVTSIGNNAFDGCYRLASITIPSSVMSIGNSAFSFCYSLESITFESPTTEIFDNEYTISDTATIYGYEGSTAQGYAEKYGRAFELLEEQPEQPDATQGTEGLIYELNAAGTEYKVTGYEGTAVHVIIPTTYGGLPVTRVTKDTFSSKNQGGIELPPDILVPRGAAAPTAVTAAAAATQVTLQSMTLLSPTVILEDSKNTIPAGVAIYGYLGSTAQSYAAKYNRTFVALDGLEFTLNAEGTAYVLTGYTGERAEVTVPATYFGLPVTEIGANAFAYMTNVTKVDLADSVIRIGENAFLMSGLTSFTVSENIVSIGVGAFNAENMESLAVESGSSTYRSCQNCIVEVATGTLIAGCKTSVIPDDGSVIAIGERAFAHSSLESISIPAFVESIAKEAFADCDALTQITILLDGVVIFDAEDTIPATAVIYGNEGSTAQGYAEKYGRSFELIPAFIPGDVDGVEGVVVSDAIYLLYNVIFGDAGYPVNQTCDFDGDGQKTVSDAIYLLYYVIFGEANYPLH